MNSDDEDFAATMVAFDGEPPVAPGGGGPRVGGAAARPPAGAPKPAPAKAPMAAPPAINEFDAEQPTRMAPELPRANEFDAEQPTRMAPELHRPAEAEIGTELFAADQQQLAAAVRAGQAHAAGGAMPFGAPAGRAPGPARPAAAMPPTQNAAPAGVVHAPQVAQPAVAAKKSGPSKVVLVVAGIATLGISAGLVALFVR